MGGPSKLGIQDPKLSSSTPWQGVHNEHAPLGSPATDAPGIVGKVKGDKPVVLFSRDAPGKLLDRIATFFKDVKAKLGQLLERAYQRFPKLSEHDFKDAAKKHTLGAKMTREVLEARIADLSKPAEDPTTAAPVAMADASAKKVQTFRSRNDTHYYVEVKPLGSGGLGMVYQVTTLNKEQAYAIKKTKDDITDNLNDEIAIHKALMEGKPSNILKYVADYVGTDGKQALVMEVLEGSVLGAIKQDKIASDSPLYKHMKANDPTWKSPWEQPAWQKSVFQQMVLGVQQMHARDVAHGDIKPENFLFRKTTVDGEPGIVVKVADFGSAWKTTRPGWNGNTTPKFMAPEMASGKAEEVGKAADVFALGLTALAVYGIRENGLYEGEGDGDERKMEAAKQFLADLSKAVDKAKSDPAQRRSALIEGLAKIGVTPDKVRPPELFDLLTRMLDPNPQVRPTIDEVLRHPYFSGSASPSTELPVSVPPGKQEV